VQSTDHLTVSGKLSYPKNNIKINGLSCKKM
jgi:hypothetical protein